MKRLLPSSISLLSALVVVTVAPWVHAEEAIDLDAVEDPAPPPKGAPGVMVQPFEGPRAKTIRDRFVRALTKSGVPLVPSSAAKTKLGSTPEPYVQVARENGVEAFVSGTVSMTKKSWTLTIEARSGATGAVAGTEQITSGWLPGLLKAIDKQAKAKLDALLESVEKGGSSGAGSATVELTAPGETSAAAAFAADPSLADGGADGDKSADSSSQLDATRPQPLTIELGVGAGLRQFAYSDPFLDTKRQELLPHSSPLPLLRLAGVWYPGAHFGDGLLSHFGINASFVRSFIGSTSVSADDIPNGAPQEYPTVFQDLDVGLRARVPMGTWEMGLNFGVGSMQMGLAGDNVVVRLPYSNQDEPYPGVVPDIDSTYYRFGGDVVFPWLEWNWKVGAAMRLPNFSEAPGALGNQRWFPAVTGTTAALSLGVTVPLVELFDLQVLADYRQTGLNMNSSTSSIVADPTNPGENQLTSSIAGGATDRYILLTAGISWGFGGKAAHVEQNASDSESEPEPTEEDSSEAPEPAETPAEPPAPAEKTSAPAPAAGSDTSNPAFFGEASGAASTPKNATPPPASGKTPASSDADTSNPDFFK